MFYIGMELVDWLGRNFKVEEEDTNKILVTDCEIISIRKRI